MVSMSCRSLLRSPTQLWRFLWPSLGHRRATLDALAQSGEVLGQLHVFASSLLQRVKKKQAEVLADR